MFYILLKAVDRFYSQYHRYPGKQTNFSFPNLNYLFSEFELSVFNFIAYFYLACISLLARNLKKNGIRFASELIK